jgi:hypothetical protein
VSVGRFPVLILGRHRAAIGRDGARWAIVFDDPKYGTCWSTAIVASEALRDAEDHARRVDQEQRKP